GGAHFKDRIACEVALEYLERVADRVGIDTGGVERIRRNLFEPGPLRFHDHPPSISSISNRLGIIKNAMCRPANAVAGTGPTMSLLRAARIRSIAADRSATV